MKSSPLRARSKWQWFVWVGCAALSAGLPVVSCGGTSGEPTSATGGASASAGGQSTGNGGAGSIGDSGGTNDSASGGSSVGGRASSAAGGLGSPGGAASDGGSNAAGSNSSGIDLKLPPADAAFDYQIGEAYDPPAGVQIVSRDRDARPAPGIYNICYVNGFQTQPEDNAEWLADHSDLVLTDSNGVPVEDEDWGEYLLDTSTAAKRAALLDIELPWIHGCKAAGFDAIEVDNLDSYNRSGGLLDQRGNVEFMRVLSAAAHELDLAVGQKNSTELLAEIDIMGTDFAVVEECNRWNECSDFQSAYGSLVFIIEYRRQDFATGCADFPGLSIVLRDLDVSGPGSSSYVYEGC